jgi:hypothetical protein
MKANQWNSVLIKQKDIGRRKIGAKSVGDFGLRTGLEQLRRIPKERM